MRFGYERLGALVHERMQSESRSRALFVFVGKRGCTMKCLTWDGTGVTVIHKKLASCRLHSIDPHQYLDEVLRLLSYWPKERYLELAPEYWNATRAKLDPDQLDTPLGSFTIPAARRVGSTLRRKMNSGYSSLERLRFHRRPPGCR